jgi:serine/threonine protein kinase
MAFLHLNNIIHGDLKPANVLMRSSRLDQRGFVAKISDFGASAGARCTGWRASTGSCGAAGALPDDCLTVLQPRTPACLCAQGQRIAAHPIRVA